MTSRNILITGATGLIGRALVRQLESQGHCPLALRRDDPDARFRYSARDRQVVLDPDVELDAVVNLAGANISARRWSASYKRTIIDSRVDLTQALARALAEAAHKPRAFLSASAIGFYGDTGATIVDESSERGDDFLAEVAGDWEAACQPAAAAGIRTVNMRFGVVLSRRGGVVKQMLLPFQFGLGGKLGDGSQYMSWVALADVLALIDLCLGDDNISGPLNFVAGSPATNAEFTRALAEAVRRPAISPFLQAWLIRLMFGEMGEALLLGSNRVVSRRHGEIGFTPACPDLASAFDSK